MLCKANEIATTLIWKLRSFSKYLSHGRFFLKNSLIILGKVLTQKKIYPQHHNGYLKIEKVSLFVYLFHKTIKNFHKKHKRVSQTIKVSLMLYRTLWKFKLSFQSMVKFSNIAHHKLTHLLEIRKSDEINMKTIKMFRAC